MENVQKRNGEMIARESNEGSQIIPIKGIDISANRAIESMVEANESFSNTMLEMVNKAAPTLNVKGDAEIKVSDQSEVQLDFFKGVLTIRRNSSTTIRKAST